MAQTEPSGSPQRVRAAFRRASTHAAIPYILGGLLLLIAVVALGRELDHHIKQIDSWIAALGPWGVLVFIGLFALASSVLIPSTVLCLIGGTLFGIKWGFAAAVVGSLLAAALQYALSRKILRSGIEKALASRPALAAIQRAVRHDEIRLQLLLRLTPLSPTVSNYMLGAAGVRFFGFMVASIGLAPGLFMQVLFGHAGKRVAGLASGGGQAMHSSDLMLFGGLLVMVVVIVLISKVARRAMLEAVAESERGVGPG